MVRTSHIDEDAAVELVNYLYVWRATLTPPVKYARSKWPGTKRPLGCMAHRRIPAESL